MVLVLDGHVWRCIDSNHGVFLSLLGQRIVASAAEKLRHHWHLKTLAQHGGKGRHGTALVCAQADAAELSADYS